MLEQHHQAIHTTTVLIIKWNKTKPKYKWKTVKRIMYVYDGQANIFSSKRVTEKKATWSSWLVMKFVRTPLGTFNGRYFDAFNEFSKGYHRYFSYKFRCIVRWSMEFYVNKIHKSMKEKFPFEILNSKPQFEWKVSSSHNKRYGQTIEETNSNEENKKGDSTM